jgi:hypothetical protein
MEVLSSPLMVTVGRGQNVVASSRSLKAKIVNDVMRAKSQMGDQLDLIATLYRSKNSDEFQPKIVRFTVYATRPDIRLVTEVELDLAEFVAPDDEPVFRIVNLPVRPYSKSASDPERCAVNARTPALLQMPEKVTGRACLSLKRE